MTAKAPGDGVDQILTAHQSRLRGFKFSISERPLFRPDDGTPANGESDSDNKDGNYDEGDECQLFPVTPSH